MPPRKLREFSVVVALATLILVAFCIFFVQVENDLQPVASPPFRFSVKLARLRAKPKETRIPQQLVLTSKDGSINSLPVAVQRNVRHTMALNPWVKVRFLGDQDCERYLLQHFNHTQLPLFFNQETRGSYRSDVCRAAVLAREGGFYTDLDVEMKWKFEDLAGNATTFLASWTEDGSVLNAMMGCTANSSFMLEVIEQLLRFYKGEPVERYGSTSEWMGPVTALAGLKAVAARDCPEQDLAPWEQAEFTCGPHVLRMFQERQLLCWDPMDPDCPGSRYMSEFPGVKYGIYIPSGPLVAWPRFANCSQWGCLTGGWPDEPPSEVSSLFTES
ncbi:unnamed protein product [Durusdinium trenchii]|uniref:Alpha-1,4-N-acetylglucosaminyltransferase n=1 Tax=Durusdinium trenchii TaxID=1381693 RepID=A0ABP0IVI8_9DINO